MESTLEKGTEEMSSPRAKDSKQTRGRTRNAAKGRDAKTGPKEKGKAQGKEKNMHNKDLGARGEELAARFLERRGFTILERNWRCFAGEADIIALDEEAIHFVEVKTRIGEGKGFPAEAVNSRKRKRYEAIAELYLGTYDGFETGVTFDVIAINVLENDRAIMRLYRNVLACDCR